MGQHLGVNVEWDFMLTHAVFARGLEVGAPYGLI